MGELIDVAVGIHAVRTFKSSRTQMHSIAAPAGLWQNGVCEAICYGPVWEGTSCHPGEPAPQLNCRCGIYGALALDHLTKQYVHYTDATLAIIAAEGRTIMGTRGIRTERARVVAWWTPRLWNTAICTAQFPHAKRYRDAREMLGHYDIPVAHDPKDDTRNRYTDGDPCWWSST